MLGLLAAHPGAATELELETRTTHLTGLPVGFTLRVLDVPEGDLVPVETSIDGRSVDQRTLAVGEHEIVLEPIQLSSGSHGLQVTSPGASAETSIRLIPAWLSILPPLVAISLALLTKEVLLSLFLGVFSGALFLYNWQPLTALARTIDHYIAPSVANPDQAAILVFTTLLGGMVGLISKSGGLLGIVDRIRPFATNPRRGQFATWVLGVIIFFDDYANVLIVGSTMRPITDRLKISREKLAYIVDSTAAPVASVFPISSWIGFEVGLIAAAFVAVDIPFNAYTTFVASIPYRFYPIFALILGFTIAVTGRDFGPMLKAERRARKTGKLLADDAVPLAKFDTEILEPPRQAPRRAINALIPILAVIVITIAGMYATGSAGLNRAEFQGTGAWLREVFGNSDSIAALCWASLGGVISAFGLALLQRIFTVREGIGAMVEGFKSVFMALIVLILAWSIGAVCDELHTADFLVGLAQGVISPQWFPVLIFLLSAAVSFATGTAWGTLGILMPLVVPIANGLSISSGLALGSEGYAAVLVGTISSVLAGSVWGDHCSPISDTTILSSTAAGSDHIAHVRTQLPYALSMGFLGMLIGDIPTAYGMSPWISLVIGAVVIVGGVLWLGRKVTDPPQAAVPAGDS